MLLGPVQKTPQTAHAELRFDAPLGEVFSYITDLRNMVVWWREHTSYCLLFGNTGPGSLYAWTYRTPWFPIAGLSIVQTRTADTLFVYYVASPGIRARFEYRFEAAAGGANVSFAMQSFLLPPPISAAELTCAFERLGDVLDATPRGGAPRCSAA